MRAITHTDLGFIAHCVFNIHILHGPFSNCARRERQRRAATLTGLRSAADSRARLYVDARLLGLG